jgi:hypothetical protein
MIKKSKGEHFACRCTRIHISITLKDPSINGKSMEKWKGNRWLTDIDARALMFTKRLISKKTAEGGSTEIYRPTRQSISIDPLMRRSEDWFMHCRPYPRATSRFFKVDAHFRGIYFDFATIWNFEITNNRACVFSLQMIYCMH